MIEPIEDRPGTGAAEEVCSAHIYSLCDPESGRPRYVGVTQAFSANAKVDLRRRKAAHLGERNGDSEKHRWLEDLRSKGLRPTIHLLETVPMEDAAPAEHRWVSELRDQGEELVNSDRAAWYSQQRRPRKTWAMLRLERDRGQTVEALIRAQITARQTAEKAAASLGIPLGTYHWWLERLGCRIETVVHFASEETQK